jgi:hypothetical protein
MDKSVLIGRPASEVFNYVLDCRNSKDYLGKNFNFQAATPPPYQVGARALALGHFAGYKIQLNYTIIELQPNRLIRLRAFNQHLNGIIVDSEVCWRFEERVPGQTIVRFHLAIQPQPSSIKGISKLVVTPVLKAIESGISYMLDGSLVTLKHTLEYQPQLVGGAV